MATKIRLNNIQLYGWHGVSNKEKETGQQFEIDVEVIASIDLDIESDNIMKTANYSNLYDRIILIFSENKYNLIETLANKISMSILQQFNVTACKVIIRKPNAPINGILDSVEVEVNNHV